MSLGTYKIQHLGYVVISPVVQRMGVADDVELSVGVGGSDGERSGCRESQGASAESERQGAEDCRRDFGQSVAQALSDSFEFIGAI